MSGDKDPVARLNALKIERDAPVRRSSPGPVLVALSVAVIAAGGAGWYFWQGNSAIRVHMFTVTAEGSGPAGSAGLDASGYVIAQRQATLSAQILDKVVYMNAEEGQQVQKGEIVARLGDSNYLAALHQAQAQERQAKALLDDVAPIYERYQRLLGQNAISTDAFQNERASYDAARMALSVAQAGVAVAQSNEDFTIIRAPFSGIVTQKVAQIGDIVSPAAAGGGLSFTGIATIVDMDSLEVEVDVSENYIDRVHAGETAMVTLNAYPDWQIPASVIAVIPTADQSKGTVKVRIAIKTKDKRILPQMAARVSFLADSNAPQKPVKMGVTIPQIALQVRGNSSSVFLLKNDGTIEMRPVTPGAKNGHDIAIRAGLEPGDRIATDNFEKLGDGTKVAVEE